MCRNQRDLEEIGGLVLQEHPQVHTPQREARELPTRRKQDPEERQRCPQGGRQQLRRRTKGVEQDSQEKFQYGKHARYLLPL
jgi:hypothetical protein